MSDDGQITAALAIMGISSERGLEAISHLRRVAGDRSLGAIADEFAEMPHGAQKAAAAVSLMGQAGVDMIPFLDLGRAGLERLYRATADRASKAEQTAYRKLLEEE